MDDVAQITVLAGANVPDGPSDLLIEIPHGATTRAEFVATRAHLVGDLPDGIEAFFHVNTDEGAPELGMAIARAVVATRPRTRVTVIRCTLPRTFIDTNRLADTVSGDLNAGGVTPGLQPYIRHPDDQAWLRAQHARYQAICDAAYTQVCGNGGLALIPHTYAPRSVGIARVDDRIVEELHRVYAPDLVDTWPLRPEVDLITRTEDGTRLSADIADAVFADLTALGLQVVDGDTYFLHPSTMGAVRALAWPGQTLSWEVRRDLLAAHWPPFEQAVIDPARVARLVPPFAEAAVRWLDRR
ncbi:MAG: hypothetical protein ACI8PZ_000582 [Myxococcota bacterium]